jgi:hypothetical protein
LAGLNSVKAALESSLIETQQLNCQLEVRKKQLESENQELKLKNENLQGIKRELSIGMATECGALTTRKINRYVTLTLHRQGHPMSIKTRA